MALIIFGIIIFIVGLVISRGREVSRRFGGPVRIIGLVIIAVGIVTSCFIQIDAGQVGVKNCSVKFRMMC